MLAISARVGPHILGDPVSLFFCPTLTLLPSTLASMRSVSGIFSSPSLPLAVRIPEAMATCTPAGSSTGYLPTRDIRSSPSEHAAEDFAADIGGAGLGIAHHAARRGQDGNAETGVDPRQFLDLRVDAAARPGDARDLLDDRFAFVIFQLDLQSRDAGTQFLGRITANEALALQHAKHVGAQLRGRRDAHRMTRALRVANPA